MKNIAINSLGYAGRVTISQRIGSKKIKIAELHNAGANPLFNFLADCLIGDFDKASIDRPKKIMLLNKKINTDDNSFTYESVSEFIYLLTNPEKVYKDNAGSSAVVRYSFVITRDKLENANFNCIALYTDTVMEPDNYAAICEVTNSSFNSAVSSALVVDWELIISNK